MHSAGNSRKGGNKFKQLSKMAIERPLNIFLVGVSCVGKTNIGKRLADEIGYKFFDLDSEIERYFNESISCIQSQFLSDYSYRKSVSKVLRKIIEENKDNNFVMALPPSGLRDWYYKELKKTDPLIIALNDSPENILKRITFYDDDSNKIEKKLNKREKQYYLRDIEKDIAFFKKYNANADYQININGLNIQESVKKLKALINTLDNINQGNSF
ncbi:MAG: hypothetical protein A7316_04055 [Candidatus Altiarchaeales archaeon WOR_SM1_86-2]|nr:MAG: hypothetical protein A7316_04055 [Candidatus Altiarchaeales archaeon WOR_SM1_86-2]